MLQSDEYVFLFIAGQKNFDNIMSIKNNYGDFNTIDRTRN